MTQTKLYTFKKNIYKHTIFLWFIKLNDTTKILLMIYFY